MISATSRDNRRPRCLKSTSEHLTCPLSWKRQKQTLHTFNEAPAIRSLLIYSQLKRTKRAYVYLTRARLPSCASPTGAWSRRIRSGPWQPRTKSLRLAAAATYTVPVEAWSREEDGAGRDQGLIKPAAQVWAGRGGSQGGHQQLPVQPTN